MRYMGVGGVFWCLVQVGGAVTVPPTASKSNQQAAVRTWRSVSERALQARTVHIG